MHHMLDCYENDQILSHLEVQIFSINHILRYSIFLFVKEDIKLFEIFPLLNTRVLHDFYIN